MKRAGLVVLAGAALLYIMTAFPRRGIREEQAPVAAPDFTLPDLTGAPRALSSFKGRVVLLDFWATWCEPCQEALPDLKRLHERYGAKGFTLLGVSLDAGGAAAVGSYVRSRQVPYPILLSGGDLPEGYPVPGLPTAFLIDRQGLITRRYLGPQAFGDLARDVETALAR